MQSLKKKHDFMLSTLEVRENIPEILRCLVPLLQGGLKEVLSLGSRSAVQLSLEPASSSALPFSGTQDTTNLLELHTLCQGLGSCSHRPQQCFLTPGSWFQRGNRLYLNIWGWEVEGRVAEKAVTNHTSLSLAVCRKGEGGTRDPYAYAYFLQWFP